MSDKQKKTNVQVGVDSANRLVVGGELVDGDILRFQFGDNLQEGDFKTKIYKWQQ